GDAGRPPDRGGGQPRAREAARRREPGDAAGRVERGTRRADASRRTGRAGLRGAVGNPGLTGTPIVARDLRRDFAGVPVLSGVDLRVAAGELVVLLGSNGAGKTTLLRILATLLRPSGGTLALFGEDASRRPPSARRQIGDCRPT